MSTFFFKTNTTSPDATTQLKDALQKMQQDQSIEQWQLNDSPENVLQVTTNKLSPEEVKHLLRATGIDADFTTAPQAR